MSVNREFILDLSLSAADALMIINPIHRHSLAEGELIVDGYSDQPTFLLRKLKLQTS